MDASAVTEDRLLGGRVWLTQPATGYRAGVDPVLLAATVPARAGETAIDAGAGVGAAALCLAVRVPGISVLGLEIDPAQAGLATANATRTGVADRVRFSALDLLSPGNLAGADHVLTNPPYLDPDAATPPPDPARARAHVAGPGGLRAWLAACLALLRPGGCLTLIHRADTLDEALAGLPNCGGIEVIPLWPGRGKPAKRVVLRARKGSRAPLVLHPGLVLHRPDGRYTDAAESVLRHAAALPVNQGQEKVG